LVHGGGNDEEQQVDRSLMTSRDGHQGSLKNHFLKEFFKEPIKVSHRTFKNNSLRHHFWVYKEPFKPGFFKEPFA